MRVLRDVVVNRADANEVHAVSQVAAVVGEEMTLDVIGAGAAMNLKVRVIESRPLMVEGVVRHQVKLAMVSGTEEAQMAEQPSALETLTEAVGAMVRPAQMEAI
jgi:hypothetical protein